MKTQIKSFDDFCTELKQCGFSMGGGNEKGIFALVPYGWKEQDTVDSPVKWHTGDPETDPWEWRMRVLEERDDISYSKVFFKSAGFITDEYYPYFYSVRRKGMTFERAYSDGTLSRTAKRIYEIVSECETAFHEIKELGRFTSEQNNEFERAVIELQTRMFITICGRESRVNALGVPYGWTSTVFATVEDFWEKRNTELYRLDEKTSYEKIKKQVLLLNPHAKESRINKFILG